jgi:DtxR family transcriptional regulator, Mn-dependent transcriptional regulator
VTQHPPLEEYLETVLELDEDGLVVTQARLADRLGHSAPTVSQMVRRLVLEGYLEVSHRVVALTPKGRAQAERVVRKHRLAERLLIDVIGLEWEDVHVEACRWEHVMSETVERRLLEILDHPTVSPYGNPIPGLDELGEGPLAEEFLDGVESLDTIVSPVEQRVVVGRIAEPIQTDEELMAVLRRVGALPGKVITVARGAEGVLVGSAGETAEIDGEAASHLFVRRL